MELNKLNIGNKIKCVKSSKWPCIKTGEEYTIIALISPAANTKITSDTIAILCDDNAPHPLTKSKGDWEYFSTLSNDNYMA